MPWSARGEPDILVPDPNDASRQRYAQIRYTQRDGSIFDFAVDHLGDGWRFYVPASSDEEGAFEVREVNYEGFWRASSNESSDLPWPEPEENWSSRTEFLFSLDGAEAIAERVSYRGISRCRICQCLNGSQSLRLKEWEWPAGFKHYVAEHSVRPSIAFEGFILSLRTCGADLC
jgi:hypothetical protein